MSMGMDEFPESSLAGWMKAHKKAGLCIGWACTIIGLLSSVAFGILGFKPLCRADNIVGCAFWSLGIALIFGLALFGADSLRILYTATPEEIAYCKKVRGAK